MEQDTNVDQTNSTIGPRPLATKPDYTKRLHTLKSGLIESTTTTRPVNKLRTSFKRPVRDSLIQPLAKHGKKVYRSMLRDHNFLNDIKHILKDKLEQLKQEQAVLQDMLNYDQEDVEKVPPLFNLSSIHDRSYTTGQDGNTLQFILQQIEKTVRPSSTIENPLMVGRASDLLDPHISHLTKKARKSAHISRLSKDREITDFERLEYVLEALSENEDEEEVQRQQTEDDDSDINNNSDYNNDDDYDDDDDNNDINNDEPIKEDDDDNNEHGIEDDEDARRALSLLIAKYGI